MTFTRFSTWLNTGDNSLTICAIVSCLLFGALMIAQVAS